MRVKFYHKIARLLFVGISAAAKETTNVYMYGCVVVVDWRGCFWRYKIPIRMLMLRDITNS